MATTTLAPTFSSARLRAARRAAGLTRTQLAAAIGRTEQRVGDYERGKHRPSVDVLGRIAGVLDVPVDALYDRARGAARTPEPAAA